METHALIMKAVTTVKIVSLVSKLILILVIASILTSVKKVEFCILLIVKKVFASTPTEVILVNALLTMG